MYHEVTASNLVLVDLSGNVIDPGSTQLEINEPGFSVLSAIHVARSDVKCVIHVHTNAGIAVSSTSLYSVLNVVMVIIIPPPQRSFIQTPCMMLLVVL